MMPDIGYSTASISALNLWRHTYLFCVSGFSYPVLTSTRRSFPLLKIAISQEQDIETARKTSQPFLRRSAHTDNSAIAPTVPDGRSYCLVCHPIRFRLYSCWHFLEQYFLDMCRATKAVPHGQVASR